MLFGFWINIQSLLIRLVAMVSRILLHPTFSYGTLTSFVIENVDYFGLKMKDTDTVRLIPSEKEVGEFEVRIGSSVSKNRLVVCPVR